MPQEARKNGGKDQQETLVRHWLWRQRSHSSSLKANVNEMWSLKPENKMIVSVSYRSSNNDCLLKGPETITVSVSPQITWTREGKGSKDGWRKGPPQSPP